jgi:hypothetical protein
MSSSFDPLLSKQDYRRQSKKQQNKLPQNPLNAYKNTAHASVSAKAQDVSNERASISHHALSKRSITQSQIEDAIPEDASNIFWIFGRRVNLDAHEEDASLYSLLRSWAQDDPFRRKENTGVNFPLSSGNVLLTESAWDGLNGDGGDKKKTESKGTMDVVKCIKEGHQPSNIQKDFQTYLIEARRRRRKKDRQIRTRWAADLKELQAKGICVDVPSKSGDP